MKIIEKAITGKEEQNSSNSEEYGALLEFYKAFNGQDLELMEKNWFNDAEIAMDNPLGGIKRGWDALSEVYTRIFYGKAEVYVEFYDYHIIQMEDAFCAVGRERGRVSVGEKSVDLRIRTSRVFKKVEGLYKQVHHHGSIESPELLGAYQGLLK